METVGFRKVERRIVGQDAGFLKIDIAAVLLTVLVQEADVILIYAVDARLEVLTLLDRKLGSGLIPYNQKMTAMAMAMADMKTSAHLS